MNDKKTVEESNEKVVPKDFLKELKEYAITLDEPCPEGHRKDPSSGRCLPIESTDHTAFTRSLNDDQGPEWRGEVDKTNTTFATQNKQNKEAALDADDMDEPESCAEGTIFSFIQRRCVSMEEAEVEDNAGFVDEEDEDAAAPGAGGHPEITQMQPEGRRDPVNHQCPPNQFFDYKNRICIPLNKDTVMASEQFDSEFKKAVATFARLAMTSPDPFDGHRHVVTLDLDGNGVTSIAGYMHLHGHDVKNFNVTPKTIKEGDKEYTSQHPGVAIPEEHRIEKVDEFGNSDKDSTEISTPITTDQRKKLSDSAFGVPGKRKFPLDTCGRVRNAMSRFNQSKGLTSSEKATLRRKILARAKSCGIEVMNFAKAQTEAEFAEVAAKLREDSETEIRKIVEEYSATHSPKSQGPCPPGMTWDPKTKSCTKMRGFYEHVVADSMPHEKDPVGRRDTPGFECPPGTFFDFKNRQCLSLDPSRKKGTTTTKAAEEDAASRKLTPQPEGRPARLPQDCPKGTIWDADLEDCKPLDSRKKTKSSEEESGGLPPEFLKNIKDKKDKKDKKGKKGKKDSKGLPDFLKNKNSSDAEEAQTPANGPGNEKDSKGCAPGEFFNPITKKCVPKKGAFKGKSAEENETAVNENLNNREGLVGAPSGKIKHPTDCPPGTMWDGKLKVCKEMDTRDKVSPGNQQLDPKMHSSESERLPSLAKIIQKLDEIIREELAISKKEKYKVAAKELPNEAFPPSLVGSTRRNLMHHTPDVTDPYDNETVDISRLRNALARVSKVEGYADRAVADAYTHLCEHAREVIQNSKKD